MDLIVVHGTPAEIRELFPDVGEVLRGGRALVDGLAHEGEEGSAAITADDIGKNLELPQDVVAYIERRARPAIREWIETFAMYVIQIGGTIEIGTSKNTPDGLNRYFRVYAPGPKKFGAAIYVHPSTGRVDFRLPAEELTEADRDGGAFLRDVEKGHPYVIATMLDGPGKWGTAQELARRAIEATASA